MTDTSDAESEIDALLFESMDSPSPDEAVALAERAVRLADAHQDVDLGYRARQRLIEAATFGGRGELALVAFAWCRARVREEPGRHPEEELLWKYKWILSHIPTNPGVRRAQIEAAYADFRGMFPAGGGERAQAKLAMTLALQLGEHDRARTLLDAWRLTSWDLHADCLACDVDTEVDVWHTLGEEEAALRTAVPVLRGGLSCAEVPAMTWGYVAEAAFAVGDDEAMRDAVRAGYDACRGNRDFLGPVGRFIGVLARTGNLAAGLRLFERHLDWHLANRMEAAGHPFLAGSRALFDALRDRGEVRLQLPSTFPSYQPEGRYDPVLLADHLHEALAASCARFDARNGNTTYTRWQEAERARPAREVEIQVG